MDHPGKPRWPRLLDELERALVGHFGVASALERARELLADETLGEARREVEAARAVHDEVRNRDGGTLLELLERARVAEAAAEAVVKLLEGWRVRERALEQLAVDVFVGAPSLGPARDPAWLPGAIRQRADEPGAGADTPVYLRDPKLRIGGHFEPEVDLMIYDPGLGTVAMVQLVDACEPEAIQEQVRRYVDRATYLRHLLLTARDEHLGQDRQIVSVELVLVYHAHDCDGDGRIDLLFEVGEILRTLAQRTDFLHSIGVNVLVGEEHGFSPNQLRRALSWLLHDTRRWFANLEQQRPSSSGTPRRLREIELEEYRLPGRRTLTLHEHARLHLLHGHNGSGKSSLVEALELMITGSIERLAGIEDYEHVVRNRWSVTPARVTLRCHEPRPEPLCFELHGHDRPSPPLSPGSRAASFRLDQTVMDRLARASDVDRAAELLAAFFSDEAEVRERWRHAMDEAEAALGRLPGRVRQWLEARRRERQDLHEVAFEQLACLREDRVSAELVDAILPMPRAQLRPLAGQLEAFAQLEAALERDGHVPTDASLWDALEAAFAQLAGELPERVRVVESVLRTLDRLGRWWQEGEGGGFESEEAYAAALDEWLELSALVEIAEQQGTILAALAAARDEGWPLDRLDEAGSAAKLLRELAAAGPVAIADLERARAHWAKRRDQLGRGLRRSSEGRGDGKPMAAARVRLDEEEVEELDRFGAWWVPTERGPGLGARIRRAIEQGEAHVFASAAIGEQAWVMPIHAAAAQMLAPLRELRDAWTSGAGAPSVEAVQEADGRVVIRHSWAIGGRQDDDEAVEWADDDAWTAEEAEEVEVAEDLWEDDDEGAGLPQADREFELGSDALSGEPEPDEPDPAPARKLRRASKAAVMREEPRAAMPQSRALSLGPTRGSPAPAPAPPAASPTRSAKPAPQPAGPGTVAPHERAPELEPGEPVASPSPPPESARDRPVVAASPRVSASDSLGLSALLERLRSAYEVSVRAHEVGAEVQDSFVMRLAANDRRALALIDALNELMALFTPARWAYEDVVLRYQQTGEIARLQFETGELRGGDDPQARARADLRLNTAQLNAFTLALFLLCAPRVDNPLGLLVLDDPLQNMDELTVTTLARGLAKLLRVLSPRWSIMMLFHGEGDLARFHDEVECAVYFLPWLSPTVRGQQLDIRCHAEDSRLDLALQGIDDLIALQPK